MKIAYRIQAKEGENTRQFNSRILTAEYLTNQITISHCIHTFLTLNRYKTVTYCIFENHSQHAQNQSSGKITHTSWAHQATIKEKIKKSSQKKDTRNSFLRALLPSRSGHLCIMGGWHVFKNISREQQHRNNISKWIQGEHTRFFFVASSNSTTGKLKGSLSHL